MPPQSELDCSFAVFPAPNVSRAILPGYHPRLSQGAQSPPPHRHEELFTEIKRQYDLLVDTNVTLRMSLRQLQRQREEALHMSQLKDQYLQAAQQRIQDLQQMVNKLEDIAQKQNRESHLEVCGRRISNLERSVEDLVQTTQDRTAPSMAEEQNGVHELPNSIQELEVRTALKSEDH